MIPSSSFECMWMSSSQTNNVCLFVCLFALYVFVCVTGMWINYCIVVSFGAAKHLSTEVCFCQAASVCVRVCVRAFMHVCLASADVGVLAGLHRPSERSSASAGWQVDMLCRFDVMPFPSGEMPIPRNPPHTHTHTLHLFLFTWTPTSILRVCGTLVSLTDLHVSECLSPSTYIKRVVAMKYHEIQTILWMWGKSVVTCSN